MPLLGSRAASRPMPMSLQHTAGLSGDRTLDGASIGTLVVVIDRAKNLPNLRSMGKQDPYCALRLGKEAKKTETDRRGGQTPRWDQELRFPVHESVDYQKLKVSVFNEDKRTDLIGECWIELDSVFRRGGGQNDAWHDLHVKGRYAGQVRIEMTFYDTRPRDELEPEHFQESSHGHVDAEHTADTRRGGPRQLPQGKRRPLPGSSGSSPAAAEQPRANSVLMPHGGARSYNTSTRHDDRHYPDENVYGDSVGHGTDYTHESIAPELRPSLPEHSLSEPFYDYAHQSLAQPNLHTVPLDQSQNSHDYHEMDPVPFLGSEMSFTNDPQALDVVHAAEVYHPSHDIYHPQPIAPLRQRRPTNNPTSDVSHSAHPSGPPHSFSAPLLPPSQQVVSETASTALAMQRQGYHEQAQFPAPNKFDQYDQTRPPPPPSHRNSAPALPALAPQTTSHPQVPTGTGRALPLIPAQQPRRYRHAGDAGYQVQSGSSPSLALSQEISQIDLGPSPSREFATVASEPRYGGTGGRLRRSRFGA